MNECDIAETCTGDSSQVCQTSCPVDAQSKTASSLIRLALKSWLLCFLSALQQVTAPAAASQPQFCLFVCSSL